jgi:lysophospholipase
MNLNVDVAWDLILKPNVIAPFTVHTFLTANVSILRIFPGMHVSTIKSFLSLPIQGIVLETFGAGNIPTLNTEFLKAIKEAIDHGIIIVNVSQCSKGLVTDLYATGKILCELGVVPGSDMTTEVVGF